MYIILTFDSTIIEKFDSQQKETHDCREVEVCKKCLFVGTGKWANAHIFTIKRTSGAQKTESEYMPVDSVLEDTFVIISAALPISK